jgi:OOP family OmpA-OmpF porin
MMFGRMFFVAMVSILAVQAAPAQSGTQSAPDNPSAAQIINALKPGAAPTAGTVPLPKERPAKPPAVSARQPNPPPPQSAPPQPKAAQVAPSINLSIDFATGSARLQPDSKTVLHQLGTALLSPALASYKFSIIGHTDTVGSPAANLALSKIRAKAVAAYLERKYHVAPDRLQAEGVGESGLLVPTPPQTPNLKNRRVQIVNTGK